MSEDLTGFNANNIKPNEPGGLGPVPAGKYLVQMIESEKKGTSSGNGAMLKLTFEIT